MACDLKEWWVKAIPSIESGWLVSWLVNLANWAKIVISEWIWLKFDMDIPHSLISFFLLAWLFSCFLAKRKIPFQKDLAEIWHGCSK